jgi:prepilin-type processing-associated H-X9-DG protein
MTFSLLGALLLTFAATGQADVGVNHGTRLFVGDEVSVVSHIDLTRLDVTAFSHQVVGGLADDEDVHGITAIIGDSCRALSAAGARDIYVLIDLADMPGYPVVVIPVVAGTDGRALSAAFVTSAAKVGLKWPAIEIIRGAVVAGSTTAVARSRQEQPHPRPELAAALAASGDGSIQVAIIPSTIQRRAIEETMTDLPAELGGGPITALTQNLRWASLTLATAPKATIRAVIQAKDASVVVPIEKVVQNALNLAVNGVQSAKSLKPLVAAIKQIKPRVEGDHIVLEADLEKTAALVSIPILRAREASRRVQCINNLKQIALAMHNYHSTNNSFPSAFSATKDGKPLLSWRVHILPYLEQSALFKEFHLDEAWDSPHNKSLIARMPMTYACPSANRKLAAEGKTCYLTPRGSATIFPGSQPIKLQDITDGTSNTILTVDANNNAAVIWTKPDDWEIEPELETDKLFGHHLGGVQVSFADGSVRFLAEHIKLHVLKALITRKGGEVIDAGDL